MIAMEHFELVPSSFYIFFNHIVHILVNIRENGDSQDDLCDAHLLS